jgi:hypothetical protein
MPERSLKEHTRDALEGSTALAALFTTRGRTLSEQIFPRWDNTEVDTDDFGQNTPKPFIVIRDNGFADTNLLFNSMVTVWVYDEIFYNYAFIEQATNIMRRLFTKWAVPVSAQNYPQWVEARFSGMGPQAVDEGWALHFQTVNVRAIGG